MMCIQLTGYVYSMNKTLKTIIKKIIFFPKRVVQGIIILPDYIRFQNKNNQRFSLKIKDFYPQVLDKTRTTGFDRHYVYHTAWAARKVQEINPQKHIDIASSLYFPAIVSAFVPVDFYDYRPAEIELSGLTSNHADLLNLHFSDNSIESISCMHTIEHVGLGRYGDPIDPMGDIKAINELQRVTAKGGSILFVTPVGIPKIEFNAHRIYSYEQIMNYFNECELVEFSLIPEHVGGIVKNANPELVKSGSYDCGCFWFKKK